MNTAGRSAMCIALSTMALEALAVEPQRMDALADVIDKDVHVAGRVTAVLLEDGLATVAHPTDTTHPAAVVSLTKRGLRLATKPGNGRDETTSVG